MSPTLFSTKKLSYLGMPREILNEEGASIDPELERRSKSSDRDEEEKIKPKIPVVILPGTLDTL